MMPEISLNILDIAQNSIKAKASLIEISCIINTPADTLTVTIIDDGGGMTKEQTQQVVDPFFTTRKTRNVGLGVPFFKLAAESSKGSFDIRSKLGQGTTITAIFGLNNINRMPLGDITSTMHTLITLNVDIDFLYIYKVDDRSFELDTRQFRTVLDGVPFNNPDVSEFIKSYLSENKKDIDREAVY